MTQPNSAHPREGGDPFGLTEQSKRPANNPTSAWVLAFAGMSGVLGLLIPATAFAHPGDHSQMAAVAMARHLLTEPDHLATLLAAVVGLAAAGWVTRTRRAG